MNGNVEIREGVFTDREFVRDLGSRTMADSVASFRRAAESMLAVSYEGLLDFVYSQQHRLLIAQSEGERVGFILVLESMPDEVTRTPQAFVAYMAVEPSARRRGIGKQLLDAAEAAAREKGLPYMGLMVTDENQAALQLYKRAGFLTERRLLCKPL